MRPYDRVDKYIELADWLSFECRNDQEALRWIERALEIEPLNVEALIVKGDVLQNMERFHEALHYYEKALEIDSNAADAWAERAQVLCALGHWEEALLSVEKGLTLLPNEADLSKDPFWSKVGEALYDAKAHALYRAGCLEDCLATLKEGLQKFPNSQLLLAPYERLTQGQE